MTARSELFFWPLLLVLLLVLGITIYVASCWLNPDKPALTSTATLTITTTDTPTSMWTPAPTTTPPSTLTPIPEEVMIRIDDVVIDFSDDRFQEIICDSSHRIEVTVLNSAGTPLQPDIFLYNWRFYPSDPHNEDKLDSKNYVINYYVPCEHNNQTVTIEVLKDGETRNVRRICFDIKKQP
jgi:hypothetical protein